MAPGGELSEMIRMLRFPLIGDGWGRDDSRISSFGPDAGTGEVNGTIDGRIEVEIGVGSPKQIRASVLDLALPPHPGKLLFLGR